MALKLIKKQDPAAARIKRFLFSGDVEWGEWTGTGGGASDGLGPSPAGSDSKKAEPPVVDVALVEKAAYESGFHEGEKAGAETAARKLEATMNRYAEALSEIDRLKSTLYARVERDVVRLAMEVAKKIVHREIQADPEIVETLVKIALSHAAGRSSVTVRLHPVDYDFMLAHRSALTESGQDDKEITLVSDKSIQRGGCLVQTECGDIDARIEEEFREVERSFFSSQE